MAFLTRNVEKQLAQSIDEDRKRNNINNTKLKAMSSGVSYDEFKNLVAAANLKPALDSKQSIEFVKQRADTTEKEMRLNSLFSIPAKRSDAEIQAELNLSNSKKVPKNFLEFEQVFVKQLASSSERIKLIGSMTFEQLKAIFQTDLTFDVIKCALSTIFDTLSVPDFLTKETTQGSYNLLLSMTYSSRFSFIFGCVKDHRVSDIFSLLTNLIEPNELNSLKLSYKLS